MSATTKKPHTLSRAAIDQAKDILRCDIESLRQIAGYPGQSLRSEIAGRLSMMKGLGLISSAEERALSDAADTAQEEGAV